MRKSTKWKDANIRGREPTSRWLTASGLNRQGRYSLLTTRGSSITECPSFRRHPIASCRARRACTGSPGSAGENRPRLQKRGRGASSGARSTELLGPFDGGGVARAPKPPGSTRRVCPPLLGQETYGPPLGSAGFALTALVVLHSRGPGLRDPQGFLGQRWRLLHSLAFL
jgi:hypothetical protein